MGVLACFTQMAEAFVCCAIATIFHEYAHFFVATKLGMEINKAEMTPFGGMIEIPLAKYPWQASLAVISAGGIANLALAVLLCAVWWFYPVSYGFTYLFAKANITIAMVNFLPCYPLDGGRGAYLWCKEVLKIRNAEKIISKIGVLLGVGFIAIFIFKSQNITLLTLGIFTLLGSEKTLRNLSQISAVEKWQNAKTSKSSKSVSQENIFVARGDVEAYKVFFHFKRSGENILKIKLESGKVAVLTQGELYERILSSSHHITTQTILSELIT